MTFETLQYIYSLLTSAESEADRVYHEARDRLFDLEENAPDEKALIDEQSLVVSDLRRDFLLASSALDEFKSKAWS